METQSPHNHFVISLSGINIDLSIINIEEMNGYCKSRQRHASVITDKSAYGELEKLNFSLVQNYKNPKARVINSKKKDYLHVYNVLSERHEKGLLIAETDTISDAISECLCTSPNWEKNDIDIMICRDLRTMTECEMRKANFLRISADPDFDPFIFQKLSEIYKEKTLAIMMSQYFVNDQYETFKKYLDIQSELYKNQGLTDYIDYSQVNKQLSYFIYYDVMADKILNLDKSIVLAFLKKMAAIGAIPLPADKIEAYSDIITI